MTGKCFLIAFIVAFGAAVVIRLALAVLNIRRLRERGAEIPRGFEDAVDGAVLSRMRAYTVDSSRFGAIAALLDNGFLLLILLSGLLPWHCRLVESFNWPFIVSGLLFMAGPAAAGFLLNLPLDLYDTFVIERRHGFSTITAKLWITDLLKGLVISSVLIGGLLAILLALVRYAGPSWWLWAWLALAVFQLVLLWLAPVVIAPLFNTFKPIDSKDVSERLTALMEKAGLKSRGVYSMDAGKRSAKKNAYFTGLGRSKRIVLFDTLLSSQTADEIAAILAHEIGHWKRKHLLKQLIIMEAISLVLFYAASRLLDWDTLFTAFGFTEKPAYVGLFLLSVLAQPLFFLIRPAASAMGRRFEAEADDYVRRLEGTTIHLATALKKLARDNLANLHPHPLYAWYHSSHPPLVERVARLEREF
ncbi:MAG: M48 family metallopeptidase [Deltaproteobacteria bacterium]|nr:M48 family metallopeptidase [Deltaproteobacteria bacterium]